MFFKEVQFYMVEQIHQPGSEIMQMGEKCQSLAFIVNGEVELQVVDQEGSVHVLETLRQGDFIG